MAAIKKTISIPDALFEEANTVSNNFSALVTIALEQYIKHVRIEQAKASFGSWEERKEMSVDTVKKLRDEKGRDYAKRDH